MLRILVEAVFDKALDEPNFVDMYADLCVRLNERSTTWSFVKVGRRNMIGGIVEGANSQRFIKDFPILIRVLRRCGRILGEGQIMRFERIGINRWNYISMFSTYTAAALN